MKHKFYLFSFTAGSPLQFFPPSLVRIGDVLTVDGARSWRVVDNANLRCPRGRDGDDRIE